jgi:hypothetical protein
LYLFVAKVSRLAAKFQRWIRGSSRAKHDAHNTGAAPLKVVAVYVVEKGKPLTTPAP